MIGDPNSGYQTIIIKQPIELITSKPDVIRVDPITGKDIKTRKLDNEKLLLFNSHISTSLC